MIRLFQITTFIFISVLPAGCKGREENEPIWKHLKITDLAPSDSSGRASGRLLKTINFEIYVFDMPAEKIAVLDNVWPLLYTNQMQFNDYKAFGANSFRAGFGQTLMWDKIAELLRGGGAKEEESVSLLLFDGRADEVAIARLYDKQTFFYNSAGDAVEGISIGPGDIVLRIKAERIPDSKGLCLVETQPVFVPLTKSSVPQMASHLKSREFFFVSAGFKLKMGPGDFVFLGPAEYFDHQATLGSRFFSRQGQVPIVRSYLIICARINE